jgi:hypothetical protein
VNGDDQLSRWRTIVFDVDTNQQTVYAVNNIFFNMPEIPGDTAGYWCLGELYGQFYVGVNWINSGYLQGRDGYPFQGTFTGLDNLITGDAPGFRDVFNLDVRLHIDSPCIGVGVSLDRVMADYPVEYQLDFLTHTWVHRPSIHNLGAIE